MYKPHFSCFQFRYATVCDRLILVFGSLFAIVHGAGWPVLTIVFGQMTDSFIQGTSQRWRHNDDVTTRLYHDVTYIIAS